MSRTRWQEPNLARAPFVNERPVRRLAVTLWLRFALVGGLAAWQAVASRQATSARLAELARLNTEAAAARERVGSSCGRLRCDLAMPVATAYTLMPRCWPGESRPLRLEP